MSMAKPLRKPFVDPSVSEPIDALDATRAFGGVLGQIVLGGGSSGQPIDDGDYLMYDCYSQDPSGQDTVDGGGSCGDSSGFPF
jgi:hypothetical protein